MCIAANEIKELKFFRECSGDSLIWREYRFDSGDYIEHLGNVQINDYEWTRSENNSEYKIGSVVHWIPTFEQYLNIYQKINDLDIESLAILWMMNFIEDRVKEDHNFCFEFQTKEETALVWIMEKCYN